MATGMSADNPITKSREILRRAIDEISPAYIVSMVSGGKDSACSHAVLLDLGIRPDLIIHGNTRCGIPETSAWVREQHGNGPADYVEADAARAYEDYVLRKGFFGRGIGAHGFAYRILKADPFRSVISRLLRRRKRDVRVMLINGARKDESENRRRHLHVVRADPSRPRNVWVNVIHDWSAADRDAYLDSRKVPINPVAKALCRSGECMCGTMQSRAERAEAAAIYPHWGRWLDGLEAEAKRLHGFGWGDPFPRRDGRQGEMFQPMCSDCTRAAT